MNVEARNDTSGNAGNVAADLVLIVEERPATGGRVFDVRLEVAPQWLPDLRHPTYGEISFKTDPVHQLRQHLRAVGDASPREQNETAALAKTLRADGAHLSRKFLPEGVRKCLATLRGQAVTLHIASAAPWIPWELLRIERTPSSSRIDGPFLCEAFAVTRGLPGRKCLPSHLPLTRLGVVMAANEQPRLPSLEREWAQMASLGRPGEREIERIEARLVPLLEAFSRGEHDGWHFSTHATFKDEAPDFSAIELDSGEQLQPFHLAGESAALGLRKPLVFLNACSSGQTGLSLTGIGGLPAEFLNAGAGACIGTLWPIRDSCAATFAHTFYQEFLAGSPIGEAVRKARTAIRSEDDPTWLAYTVFAHPGAVCGAEAAPESPASPTVCEVEPFETQERAWDPVLSPPAALLRAEYGIVRFHWRKRELEELEELEAWCLGNVPLGVRLYTGPGGMGKTRLAIELANRLRDNGWQAGFFPRKDIMAPKDAWRILQRRGGRMLLVIDYAETRRDILVPLLQEILREKKAGPVRVLLLARAALDWWENLKREGDGIGELLSGPATSRHHLGALAFSVPQRVDSFGIAMMDFAGRLHRPVPAKELETPDKPSNALCSFT